MKGDPKFDFGQGKRLLDVKRTLCKLCLNGTTTEATIGGGTPTGATFKLYVTHKSSLNRSLFTIQWVVVRGKGIMNNEIYFGCVEGYSSDFRFN